jgi:PIN domain nuclease of toxin-antitoxin system
VILLDTHIWVWWVSRPERLQRRHRDLLELGTDRIFGVSIISCWEVAKLVEYGRLKLDRTVGLWIEGALAEPAYRFSTSIRRSWWNPLNCPSLSIVIQPTNYWSQRLASWRALS